MSIAIIQTFTDAVKKVKKGLESEGLTGLGDDVIGATDAQEKEDFRIQPWNVKNNSDLRLFIYPWSSIRTETEWIQLNYQTHILPHVKWSTIQAPNPNDSAPESMIWQSAAVDVGDAPPDYHAEQAPHIDKTIGISGFARRLSDLLPSMASRSHCNAHARKS